MMSGSKQENDRLEREQKRLEINTNIGRPEGFPLNELNTRWLRTWAILVTPPVESLDLVQSHKID